MTSTPATRALLRLVYPDPPHLRCGPPYVVIQPGDTGGSIKQRIMDELYGARGPFKPVLIFNGTVVVEDSADVPPITDPLTTLTLVLKRGNEAAQTEDIQHLHMGITDCLSLYTEVFRPSVMDASPIQVGTAVDLPPMWELKVTITNNGSPPTPFVLVVAEPGTFRGNARYRAALDRVMRMRLEALSCNANCNKIVGAAAFGPWFCLYSYDPRSGVITPTLDTRKHLPPDRPDFKWYPTPAPPPADWWESDVRDSHGLQALSLAYGNALEPAL